jgi:hypothetical protein
MNVRSINLSVILLLAFSIIQAQGDKKLLGTWEVTIDYETYQLEFISGTQLVLNGETHQYTLSENRIVVDYQHYPYAFRDGDLYVTADGVEYKLTRVADRDPLVASLLGQWENQGAYGLHRLTFHSGRQAEYDGERVGFTIQDNAFVVDYEKYPFQLEGDVLQIQWPGESEYRKFTRVKD